MNEEQKKIREKTPNIDLLKGRMYTLEEVERIVREAQQQATERAEQKVNWVLKELRESLTYHEDNLIGWKEPDGYLIPTEPSPEERGRVIRGLLGAIHATKEAIKLLEALSSQKETK